MPGKRRTVCVFLGIEKPRRASDLWVFVCACVAAYCRFLIQHCLITRSCATIKDDLLTHTLTSPPVRMKSGWQYELISHRKDPILDLQNIVSEMIPAKKIPIPTLFHLHSCFEKFSQNKGRCFHNFFYSEIS